MDDVNPWRQLINTINRFQDWFTNNQRRFVQPLHGQYYQRADVKVWPVLLVLSDPVDLVHRLPFKPQNNFGSFQFSLDTWVSSIDRWAPRVGLKLTGGELADLARVLGVHRPDDDRPSVESGSPPAVEAAASQPPDAVFDATEFLDTPGWVDGFVAWASEIERRVRRLEQQTGSATRRTPVPTRPHQELTVDEREMIQESLFALKNMGKRRDFPNLFAEMHRRVGGDTFKNRNFNGYGSARAMMDQAEREGVVKYGPPDANGLPTLLFPRE
jgi:hypothetical protein